jgi:hypothetical protein
MGPSDGLEGGESGCVEGDRSVTPNASRLPPTLPGRPPIPSSCRWGTAPGCCCAPRAPAACCSACCIDPWVCRGVCCAEAEAEGSRERGLAAAEGVAGTVLVPAKGSSL